MTIKVENLFVVGTDTGVGKTVLSLLLMQYFLAVGRRPFYFKPFQTGCQDPCDTDSDARFVYEHVSALKDKNPADSVLYCLGSPKAPWFAGRDAQCAIDVDLVCQVLREKSTLYAPMIMEGAGGLLVPVTEKIMMIDVVKMTGAIPVLAARAGLGTINHTLLAVEALQRRDILPIGIVFVDPVYPPTSEAMIRENREAVERISGIMVAGVIGKISDFANPDAANRRTIERLLQEYKTES